MINRTDLLQEIKECQKTPLTEKQFTRLANCFIVYDHLYAPEAPQGINVKEVEIISTDRSSDFLAAIDGKDPGKVYDLLDELVQTVGALYPNLYDSLMRRISDI